MAIVGILLTILAIPASLLIWSYICLQRNRVIAETIGFPLLVRWISPTNPFWLMMGSTIVLTCRKLHLGTAQFRRLYLFGWEGNERSRIHEVLGSVFTIVSPGGNCVCVSDAIAIDEVIRRPKDYRRNMEQMAILNVYGKNLSTTDDEEWQKHRKVTAMTFNERGNELVWRESIVQAKAMLRYWTEQSHVTSITTDTKIFTLNVLAAAIFNKNYPFEGANKKPSSQTKDEYRYRDSLNTILGSIIQIFIFGEQGLKAWWMPKSWKAAANAIDIFRSYILTLIAEEQANASHSNHENQHLVAALVRASESSRYSTHLNRKTTSLTETEIISNLFVFAFAGNDTTAVVLAHLLVDLATHPQTQAWIAEEINHYLPSDDTSTWSYHTFPKLKRCQAVIYEALRLNHPLSQLIKTTKDTAQNLNVEGQTYTIPAGTSVHLSLSALHTHPKYWGDSGMTWKPERFITTSGPGIENEILAPDTSKHFLPWAYGQRICPGKKFSQVELVAALAALFRGHVVVPRVGVGQSVEQARRVLERVGRDIDHEGTMLYEIAEGARVNVVWSRRGE